MGSFVQKTNKYQPTKTPFVSKVKSDTNGVVVTKFGYTITTYTFEYIVDGETYPIGDDVKIILHTDDGSPAIIYYDALGEIVKREYYKHGVNVSDHIVQFNVNGIKFGTEEWEFNWEML